MTGVFSLFWCVVLSFLLGRGIENDGFTTFNMIGAALLAFNIATLLHCLRKDDRD